MKKGAKGKDFLIEQIWLWSSISFITIYSMILVKVISGLGINKRVLHIGSCLSLIATYSSCIFFKSSAINIQKLLKDGNFRCLLVACSLLSVRSMVIPMMPFLLMSTLSVAGYINKNRSKFEKTSVVGAAHNLAIQKDQITLFALKIEVLSLPLIFLHLVLGSADLFLFVSYASMVWYEYTTNPRMKSAVYEIIEVIDRLVGSSNVPHSLREKYSLLKEYIKMRLPVSEGMDASGQPKISQVHSN
ncbi:hypothetical protein NEAUS04_0149 [Nematocida ausubeli]|uniref:Uncharacterized protein n=1 Tax=Nematocida ausubeli (strain ATCC PRA-371 / ERTm2) TaxID=1913371 RepID=A0A086J3K6_NEMA1|nr:uncharacterized protein NESG_00878 [Nematocida ausubeli]KAI5134382.1 hypothetical protein NEAUS07_0799 [Nematocida ausubeli]KAI5134406.1 hypothetical protein NEAUS07_0823 [Nematocida ausubeli]KAI5147458.1 hypothetical protein NEAUS05_0763 [Nematocida ausubeli]KAI5147625.1 hypothetical protein NEAUS05_0919 [Nematocida ausubeli]KAI5160775.1 hypothetical protein NEAUS04_0149 [Nematocida ausubeli]